MASPPRARRTQAERSADTQRRALEATIDCIVEHGFAGASTPEICRRARISRGALLHHYPAKADLVGAAIERLFDERLAEFRAFLGAAPGVPRALAELWAIYTGKTFYAWAELLVASRTDRALRQKLRVVDDRFFAAAQQACRALVGMPEGHDARVAAITRLILSALDGLALNHTLGGRDELVRGVLAELQHALATELAGHLAPRER